MTVQVTSGPAVLRGGEHLLADITATIGRVMGSVTEVGAAMTALAAAARAGRRPLRRADLAALRPLVAQVLARHRGFAAGAGLVLAPDALADAPRCIDWWWADRGSGPGQLEVDLDPASAEFYDYTTTEWYNEPARTGQPCVAGPYVDYICTHEYTFTVSVPMVDGGRFVGVAGADITHGLPRVVEIFAKRLQTQETMTAQIADAIEAARKRGGSIIAVGTTTVRCLEASAAEPGEAETDLFITPGFGFRVVDRLVTNFHLPKSTLLMLVSAFAGLDHRHVFWDPGMPQEFEARLLLEGYAPDDDLVLVLEGERGITGGNSRVPGATEVLQVQRRGRDRRHLRDLVGRTPRQNGRRPIRARVREPRLRRRHEAHRRFGAALARQLPDDLEQSVRQAEEEAGKGHPEDDLGRPDVGRAVALECAGLEQHRHHRRDQHRRPEQYGEG